MLTGKELGAAIEAARKLKGVTKVAMAKHFGLAPPSIQDWVKRGTIDKDKLEALWDYFKGVVGPEHWGLGEGFKDAQSEDLLRFPPGSALFTKVKIASKTYQPGLVYSWDEVVRMFRAGIEEGLPDVFSVELMDDALIGRARKGDVVTLSRSQVSNITAGDGVLVRTSNDAYMLRIYRPKGDGTFVAEATNPNFLPLHSTTDGLIPLAVVVGVPSCKWSAL